MASAGTVTVDFAAETAKFTTELKKVQTSLGRLESSFLSLNKVGSMAARIFTGGVLVNLAKSAFEAADATADAAARAGIAVETFSRLQFAAKMTDSSMEALTTGVQKFQVAISNAAAGNKQAQKTLAEFGLSVEQLRGLSIEQQLGAVADSFAKIQSPADRTRLAVELFGRSAGPQLVPLLTQGKKGLTDLMAEADRLGVTMSSQAAAAIDQTDAAVKRLTASIGGFKNQVVAGLSILILGDPDEAGRINAELEKIDIKIKQYQSWKPVEHGGQAMPEADVKKLELLLAKQKELSTAYWAEIGKGGEAIAAADKARADATAVITDTGAVQEVSITHHELIAEVDELAEAYRKLAESAQEARDKMMSENMETIGGDVVTSSDDIQKQITQDMEDEIARRNAATADARAFEYQQEVELAASKAALQEGFFDAGIDALHTFAGQSEKAAKALVLINKAQAIAQAIQNTAVAVTKAYAQGGIFGIASAAALAALGAAQVALIVRSAYGQMSQIQAHGGAPIGSPVNPVHTQTEPTQAEEAEGAGRVVQVVINGNYFGSRETVDYLIEAFREEIDSKDVVLFSPASRQAQEIRAQ
jgi:hypothetical protein